MDGQKLLIVEDCESVAQLLAANLRERFAEVVAVGSLAAARRGFRLADRLPFDFVICGLSLPDGSGLEFKRWLEDYLPSRRLPFIFIAGSLPGMRLPQSGVVMLAKPFQLAELLRALDAAREKAAHPPAGWGGVGIPLPPPRGRLSAPPPPPA